MRHVLRLLSVLAVLALGLAPAQETYVTFNADGSITIRLLTDDETVTFAPGELGNLVGPGLQPYAGKTITVTTNSGGVMGGISGPIYQVRPAWEELTGAKLNIVEIPLGEAFPQVFADLQLGTGQFDGFIVGADWYGDLVEGDFVVPVDTYFDNPGFPTWDRSGFPPSLQTLYTWGGRWYGTLNDSDGQVLYYRRDILTDPAIQAEYQAATGRALVVPPPTWDDVLSIARFLNGRDLNGDGEGDSGVVLHLKVNAQGLFHFISLAVPFVVTRPNQPFWFDPDTMDPIINSPGHVRALEFLIELSQYGPAAQVGWDLGEGWDYFLRGRAAFVFSWGDVGSLVQIPERSDIKGKLGASILPGVREVYDTASGQFVAVDPPNVVGNTTGGSWHGMISVLTPNPDVVYHLWATQATRSFSLWNVRQGWTGVDPGMAWHFVPPYGNASLEAYLSQGWNADDIVEYHRAYRDNYFAPLNLSFLRIPGAFEYRQSLDQNLSKAESGQLTPQEALDLTFAQWQETTDRLGRDRQRAIYRASLGLE
ncbi:MAG: extracellular solute-binding protein [Deinococcus sp.]|nr:extracellular solute-binding protein [Deinococcus sp.]